MKIRNKRKVSSVYYTIDYENGVNCDVTVTDSNRLSFSFMTNGKRLHYVEDISILQSQHWSDHQFINDNFFESGIIAENVQQLLDFKNFDKLVIIGGGMDGTLRDYKGHPITSLQKIGHIDISGFGKINRHDPTDAINFVKKAKLLYWVMDAEVYKIPEYNDGGTSANIEVLLTQEMYTQMFLETKSDYFDSKCIKWIVNKIKES